MSSNVPTLTVPSSYSTLSKEDRRILSGAYGKPRRVPVIGMLCNCTEPHSFTWAKPGSDVEAYYETSCPWTREYSIHVLETAGVEKQYPFSKYSTDRLIRWAKEARA